MARGAFIREGYAAASMSKISEIVGGSKRTLYALFPSKKDLFCAVIEEECARLFDQVFAFGPLLSDPRSAVVLFAQRFVTKLLSDDIVGLDRLSVAESVRFPQVGQVVFEFAHTRGLDRLMPYMEQAIEKGVLRAVGAREAAEFLLYLCAGSPLQRLRLWNVVEKVAADEIERYAHHVMIAFLAVYGNDTLASEVRKLAQSR